MKPGRMRLTTDSAEERERVLAELVDLGILDATTVRRREYRHVFYAYARLTPQFS